MVSAASISSAELLIDLADQSPVVSVVDRHEPRHTKCGELPGEIASGPWEAEERFADAAGQLRLKIVGETETRGWKAIGSVDGHDLLFLYQPARHHPSHDLIGDCSRVIVFVGNAQH